MLWSGFCFYLKTNLDCQVLQAHGRGGDADDLPLRFQCDWAFEWDLKCVRELRSLPDPPTCVFQDLSVLARLSSYSI
eukprot:9690931-Alexandrium_andersonii.AAC.1